MIPILNNCRKFGNRTAIIDKTGSYTYNELYQSAQLLSGQIQQNSTDSEPVLMLLPSGFQFAVCQFAIWLSGKMVVPIHTAYTNNEIQYLVEDTGAQLLIYDERIWSDTDLVKDNSIKCITYSDLLIEGKNSLIINIVETSLNNNAFMIYTSGTTGKPKGVVISHYQLDHQIRSLTTAWKWTSKDRILNVLPMHHIHGLVNITCCALYNGAIVEMQQRFDTDVVCKRMGSGELTLFMAVPTIYHKLISYFENLNSENQKLWQQGMRAIRLMVSGSAALPIPILEKWRLLSGHTLLERYGMTEIGMALSNPLEGERRSGTVGQPLPFIEVKIMDENGNEISEFDTPGELFVKGPTVFKYYWKKPEQTAAAFEDDWFKTGDVVAVSPDGYYRVLGRMSSDIIKSGGYKISSLEIENQLLEHPQIRECAVVGIPDEVWGEVIGAAIVGTVEELTLKEWLKYRIVTYRQPHQFKFVDELPRNAMGKVLKKEIQKWF